MFKKLSLLGAAFTMSAAALIPATPAAAQSHRGHHYGHYDRHDRGHYRNYDRYDRRAHYDRRYAYRRGARCDDNGDGGTVIGAIAGGLAGHEVVGRYGDKTAGTLVGGVVGALAGRAIDRSDRPDYCR
ncbi:glycine zipper 2TM domain-containing protein [Stakelama saccharophila]|uniref:17 kDa surface antigen n=1 Tax=Stakelama saccharophila TaxID=3075605 RepID=A0ABZ0BDD7_9SPHN|nr:glycine zipper 2TM domain-containing protein [Stakelama sp. W311]WNO54746.1 glycine zipper 2TM domain-containing protein [Stakelama sp. W311]